MTRSDSPCKIDGVEVGELSFVRIGSPTPVLQVKFAYVNSDSGDRFGYGTRNIDWSEHTLSKLSELVAAIEADVVLTVFGQVPTAPSGIDQDQLPPAGISSL